nr:MAG TPA: hypothetical protein [Caudoviricetes sp.]
MLDNYLILTANNSIYCKFAHPPYPTKFLERRTFRGAAFLLSKIE